MVFIRLIKYIFILLGFFLISSCSSKVDSLGYVYDNNNFDLIKKNVTSKATLLKNFGSPSSEIFLNDSEYWIYYSEEFKKILFFKPTIISRRIVILKFNEDRVSNIQNLDLNDANNKYFVNLNTTHVPHHNYNIFKEIFQNVGIIKP